MIEHPKDPVAFYDQHRAAYTEAILETVKDYAEARKTGGEIEAFRKLFYHLDEGMEDWGRKKLHDSLVSWTC